MDYNEIVLESAKMFLSGFWEVFKIFLPFIFIAVFAKSALSLLQKYLKKGKRRYSKDNDIRSINGKFNLDNLDNGFHFEEYIADLLIKLNYENVKLLPPASDYGTDILAEINGVIHAVQCKYYSNKVGIKAIQEIMGGKKHYNAHVAVVVTNNGFTNNAIELAKSNNVLLWDRKDLQRMISRAKV